MKKTITYGEVKDTCLDVINNGGSSSEEYSTDEKVVGKWVDGSNVYEKTIISTTNSVPSENKILATITGFTKLISIEGTINGAMPINHVNPKDSSLTPQLNSWSLTFVTASGEVTNRVLFYTDKEIIVTLRYLK